MSERIELEIVTPEEPILSDEATEVVLPGELGEVGILPGHVPLITSLKTGALQVHENGLTKKLFVDGGFAEVSDNTINVLAERCEFAEDIHVDKAKSKLDKAEDKLESLEQKDDEEVSEREIQDVKEAIKRMKSRISIATDGELD